MKIKIERGKRKYEVVPCGRKCGWARPFVDAMGHADVCANDCNCPKWWSRICIIDRDHRDGMWCGLREIGGAE